MYQLGLIFKPSVTYPLCLLISLTLYRGCMGYNSSHIYQPSLCHARVFWHQYLGYETPLQLWCFIFVSTGIYFLYKILLYLENLVNFPKIICPFQMKSILCFWVLNLFFEMDPKLHKKSWCLRICMSICMISLCLMLELCES